MNTALRWVARASAIALITMLGPVLSLPGASAIPPPIVDTDALPTDSVGPEQPMRLESLCQTLGALDSSDFADPSPGWELLNIDATRPFATGAGITVAVIDTGVTANPRLPNLQPGGDYVASGDGLDDCDAHGTVVAAVIGSAPSDADGFVGVAPDATLISIRQSSAAYTPEQPASTGDDPDATQAAADLRAMARAVVHAVNLGAQVINISTTTCMGVLQHADDTSLGAAVHWAVADRDVVVVAAAGDTGGSCTQNPPPSAVDSNGWDSVATIASPSWWTDDVLTVGSVTNDGAPAPWTLQGPWVDVAAPGESIVGIGNSPEGVLVNGLPDQDGVLAPISGTAFSAAYVSGVAALVRQKYPELNAYQIMNRIKETAHTAPTTPDPALGWGVIDPLAALTVFVADPPPTHPVNQIIIPAPPPAPPDLRPRQIATYLVTASMVSTVAGLCIWVLVRRRGRA